MAAFGPALMKGAQTEGAKAGQGAGVAFGKAFAATDTGSAAVVDKLKKASAAAEKAVASETATIAKARAAQRDATAKVIEAEDRLEKARQAGDPVKVAAAEERLAGARDRLAGAASSVEASEKRLSASAKARDAAVTDLAKAESKLAVEQKQTAESGDKSASAMGRFKGQVAEAGTNAKASAVGFGKAAVALAGVVGAVALVKEGWSQALDMKAGINKMRVQLDLTQDESKTAGMAAGALYAKGWGDSASDVTGTVSTVISSIRELKWAGVDEIAGVTRQAQALADAFDIDVSEAARNAGVWITNGLAGNATDAFDLMMYSMQRVPQGLRGEVMDASHEYAQFFGQMGMDSVRMMETFVGASAMGQYAIDKVGDSVKEFSIRATDGSKSSSDAFKVLGLDATKMARDITAGGDVGAAAFQKTVDRLLAIKDPAKQAQTAIALFGTPMEDLGTDKIPFFLESLAGGQDAFEGWQGAATDAADSLEGAVSPIEQLRRSVTSLVSDALLPFVSPAKDFSAWAQENPKILQGMVTALGLLAAGVAVATAAQWAYNAAQYASPTTWLILGIVALVAAIVWLALNWENVTAWMVDTFGPALDAVGQWFADVGAWFGRTWDSILGFFQGGIDWITSTFTGAWEDATGAIGDGVTSGVDTVTGAWAAITGVFDAAVGWIQSTFGPLWSGYLEPILVLPMNVARWAITSLWGLITGLFQGAVNWVQSTFGPAWNAAIAIISLTMTNAWNWVTGVWNGIIGAFSWAWSMILGWVTGKWNLLSGLIGGVMDAAKNWIGQRWNDVMGLFSGVWGFVSGWVASKWDQLTGLLQAPVNNAKGAIDLAMAGVKAAFESTVRNVTSIWAGIQEAVKAPIRFVIDVVLNNGLIGAFNTIAGFVGSKKMEPIRIPGFDTGGYTGPGGRLQPAGIVHAGEVVWSQADVAAWGGPQRVDAMRQQRQGYAGGGIVANATQGFRNYNDTFLNAIRAWAGETGRMFYMTGNGGSRSRADQERAYALYLSGRGPLAARPGTSAHEGGRAMDVNPWPSPSEVALLSKYNLGLTVRGEPWHIGWRGGALPGGSTGGGGGFGLDIGGMFKGLVDKIPKVGGDTGLSQLLNAVPGKLVEGVTAFITDKIAAVGSFFTGGGGGTAAGAPGVKDLAQQLAAGRGWTGPQWSALDWLVNKESSWNPSAKNPTSTAYGLFQFLDSTWAGVGARKTSDPRAPIVNAAVMSNAAPSYAPLGQHLVQASALLPHGGGEPHGAHAAAEAIDEATVRTQVGEIFGCDTGDWRLVTRHVVPHALPVQPPGQPIRQEVDLGGGRFVCGDHRDTGSIQGAIVSGRRTAAAVLARVRP